MPSPAGYVAVCARIWWIVAAGVAFLISMREIDLSERRSRCGCAAIRGQVALVTGDRRRLG